MEGEGLLIPEDAVKLAGIVVPGDADDLAGGDARALMGPFAGTLAGISLGAVFMGALTYIGNAPNFMIYAIATERGIKMPSFFGYLLWSSLLLLPIFALLTLLPTAPSLPS